MIYKQVKPIKIIKTKQIGYQGQIHLNSVYQLVKSTVKGKIVQISIIVFLHFGFCFPKPLRASWLISTL